MSLFDRIFSGASSDSPSASSAKSAGPKWKMLEDPAQIQDILSRSYERPCLVFKHSTRCSISAMALNRLEKGWNLPEDALDCWFIDLIAFRNVSQAVAQMLRVEHESPQVILVRNGAVFYHSSHSAIQPKAIEEALNQG